MLIEMKDCWFQYIFGLTSLFCMLACLIPNAIAYYWYKKGHITKKQYEDICNRGSGHGEL